MGSRGSDLRHLPAGVTTAVKIIILGPFAVGKTTFVGAVSEIPPARTEERMTQAGALVDDLHGLADKTTTTVALDFGRITIADQIALYLFGAPGQERFAFMIKGLMGGALGGVVLCDTRRITESYDALARVEEAGLRYVVAVNTFEGAPDYSSPDLRQKLREALDLEPDTPLVFADVRERDGAKDVLIALVRHLMDEPQPKEQMS